MENGCHGLVRTWLFQENQKIDEVEIAYQTMETTRKKMMREEKIAERKEREQEREEEREKLLEEGRYQQESDYRTANPEAEDMSGFEFDETLVEIPILTEEEMEKETKEEEELQQAKEDEENTLQTFPLRSYVAKTLCKEIMLIPDDGSIVADAVEVRKKLYFFFYFSSLLCSDFHVEFFF